MAGDVTQGDAQRNGGIEHACSVEMHGDAFVGGLLFTLSRENYWNHALLAEAISNANACGAMAVTAKGAMTALPYPDQLNTFLSSRSLAQAMTVK